MDAIRLEEISRDVKDTRMELAKLDATIQKLGSSIDLLEQAAVHMHSTMTLMRRMVPIDVVAWIFVIALGFTFGVAGIRAVMSNMANAIGL